LRGVFAKYGILGFSRIFGIILLKKSHGICTWKCTPGARHCSVGAVHGLINPDQRGSSF
jgi:hypothetical protein